MSKNITKHPDLIRKENEIKDLQSQLKKKKSTLKSLKTRLQNMQKEIEDISKKVQSQMMRQMEQMDQLQQEIAALARQLKKSKGISEEDKQALEGIAEDLSGEDMFGDAYDAYKEHKERLETGNFDFDEEQQAKMRDIFQQFQVKPPEEEQRNIRKVFIKLSQTFHPDRAKNKKEEAQFHEMMQQINEAYQQNDIHVLLEMERLYLTEELDFTSQSITIGILDQAIQRLQKELTFINNQIKRTSSEIKNIRQSDMGNMLTFVNKAEKEGEGLAAMDDQNAQVIKVFTQLRDGLKHSIEIDAVSPKLIQMMMGPMMDGLDEEEMDMEDFMSMMGMMENKEYDEVDSFNSNFFGTIDEDIENPKFPIESSVRVIANQGHEFDEKIKMKGWEGRVLEAYYEDEKPTYKIEFDSITVLQMPTKLIKISLENNDEFDVNCFLEHQLEACQPRDKEEDVFGAYRTQLHKNRWNYLPKDQAKRIEQIMLQDPGLSDTENWSIFFEKHSIFPFNAKTKGLYSEYGIPEGMPCKVLGIDFAESDAGHIFIIQPKGTKHKGQHPIIDLIPSENASTKVKEICSDYSEWATVTLGAI